MIWPTRESSIVNMLGEIVWQYDVPEDLINYVNPGFSVVPLQNGNILAVFPRNGVYEINRTSRDVVWKFIDPKASHDAERLGNGDTLVVDGGYGQDTLQDAEVREVSPQGQVVWSWYARDHGFNQAPYTAYQRPGMDAHQCCKPAAEWRYPHQPEEFQSHGRG